MKPFFLSLSSNSSARTDRSCVGICLPPTLYYIQLGPKDYSFLHFFAFFLLFGRSKQLESCYLVWARFVACIQWLITHKAALGSLIPSLAEIWLFSSHFHKNGCDKLRCLLCRFSLQNGTCWLTSKQLWPKSTSNSSQKQLVASKKLEI